MAGWSAAFRIARRDAWRARGRSALVVVLIALPVLVVTAASVFLRTLDVTPAEAPEWWMGSADALLTVAAQGPVEQGVDPNSGPMSMGYDPQMERATLADIRRELGRAVPAVQMISGSAVVSVAAGSAHTDTL